MAQPSRIALLEGRLKADPGSVVFAALAEEYRRAGRLDDAVTVCRTGLARHPTYVSARVILGRALLDQGELEAARHELEAVIRVSPENLAAVRGLAELHRRRGEVAEALEQFERALELAPQDRDLRTVVGELEHAAVGAPPPAAAPPDHPSPEAAPAEPVAPESPQLAGPDHECSPVVAVEGETAVPEALFAPEPGAEPLPPEEGAGQGGGDLLERQRRALEHFLAEIVRERERRATLAG